MAKQRNDTQGDEDDAENNAWAGFELDEQAEKVETEKKDERTGDGREGIAVLFEENTDGAGGCSKRDEDDGKAGDEGERGAQQAGARNFALAELLHANARKHGDVARNKRQNTGRKKCDPPGEKS